MSVKNYYQISHPGLGDIISALQYCQQTNKINITHENPELIQEILSLFPNNLNIKNGTGIPVKPHWHYAKELEYIKTNVYIESNKHVCIALVPNSFNYPDFKNKSRLLSNNFIKKILNIIQKEELINISGNKIILKNKDIIKEHGSDTLRQKFELLVSAKLNICADTGIAHMAAMTNIPTIVILPEVAYNRYNGNQNIHMVSNYADFEKKWFTLNSNHKNMI